MSKPVNIIIVNYNCWTYTVDCISSLLNSTNTNFNVFIVDNQSTDNSIYEIEKWSKKKQLPFAITTGKFEEIQDHLKSQIPLITLIKNDENRGFGAGNNVILKPLSKVLKESFVWLLNPDTEVEKKVLEDLINLAEDKEKIMVELKNWLNQLD